MDEQPEDEERVAFCHREHPRLVGALSLYTGNRDLARELAQEALAIACRDWSKVSRMHAPGVWVQRVALNLAKRQFSRWRAERRALARRGPDKTALGEADVTDRVAVRQAVAGLPRRQRTALVLRYYADLPVAEVAEVMGCAPGTVKALTSQAVARLRDRGGLIDVQEVPDAR